MGKFERVSKHCTKQRDGVAYYQDCHGQIDGAFNPHNRACDHPRTQAGNDDLGGTCCPAEEQNGKCSPPSAEQEDANAEPTKTGSAYATAAIGIVEKEAAPLWGSPDQTNAVLWASVIIVASAVVGLRARSSFQSVKPRSVSRRTTQNLVRNAITKVAALSMFATMPRGGADFEF
ncbi:hypothetical protein [Mesorhizobium ciceri]|uniref:hypothetical protein n=1 Tax=Mesorhizobium TaxID=68287 RepID=UPI0012DD291C|nr:hypothetical protein [Mesorhizobium ciceri]